MTGFAGLFDDASLFPPGELPMARAVPAHGEHRTAWYRDLVGPFVCPAAKLTELAELAELAGAMEGPLAVHLTGDPASVERGITDADPRIEVAAVEVPAAEPPSALLGRVPMIYLEGPRDDLGWLDALPDEGVRPKLRTGGPSAAAFPSEEAVAAFIIACVERGLRFKCTAGLHHAARNTEDGTGFEQHGFLNVLLATALAAAGERDVVPALRERSGETLAAELVRRDLGPARRAFRSFGTCSIAEPLDDLIALGLIDKEAP